LWLELEIFSDLLVLAVVTYYMQLTVYHSTVSNGPSAHPYVNH